MFFDARSRSQWPTTLNESIKSFDDLASLGEEALSAIHTMRAVLQDFYNDRDEEDELYPTDELERCAELLRSAVFLMSNGISHALREVIDECSGLNRYVYSNRPQPDYSGEDGDY